MTGPQTEIEIRLWRDEFARMRQTPEWTDAAMDAADDLLHRYRARYGLPQPSTPPVVWYDEPPFKKDGGIYYCWVEGSTVPQSIYWSGGSGAWLYFCNNTPMYPLNGRRVSPITKPQEPNQ